MKVSNEENHIRETRTTVIGESFSLGILVEGYFVHMEEQEAQNETHGYTVNVRVWESREIDLSFLSHSTLIGALHLEFRGKINDTQDCVEEQRL